MSPPEPCIDSNPDIAGIGVRSAIYAQALLSFVPTFVYLFNGRFTPHKEKTLNSVYVNPTIALALLINAFIQAGKFGIPVYHALVILNLSCINSVGAIAWYFNYFASRRSVGGLRDFISNHLWPSFLRWPAVLASLQLCMMGALGLWVWGSISIFGNQPNCTPDTVASLFFRPISLENKALRNVSIVFYSIAVIPIANLILLLFLFLLQVPVVMLLGRLMKKHVHLLRDPNKTLHLSVMLGGAFIDILFAIDTELLVHRNQGLVKDGEEVWGFGQTLAVLVVILSTIDVIKEISNWIKSRKGHSVQPVATANADGPVVHLDDGSIRVYYQGADDRIYQSFGLTSEKGRTVSHVEARARTPIATLSWGESIHVYYIDQRDDIREVHSSDGGAVFVERTEPIAKAAKDSGLLYAIANPKVPGTIRVGFHSAFDPTSITEVIFQSQEDFSAQSTAGVPSCANSSAIQLHNGDTRIYFQGVDGHLYERHLDSSRSDVLVMRLGRGEVLPYFVATTWGNKFKHIRVYFVDRENNIREICSDYGLEFVVRRSPVGRVAPNSALLYATIDRRGYRKITVGYNSMSDPLIKEVSFPSPMLKPGLWVLCNWIFA